MINKCSVCHSHRRVHHSESQSGTRMSGKWYCCLDDAGWHTASKPDICIQLMAVCCFIYLACLRNHAPWKHLNRLFQSTNKHQAPPPEVISLQREGRKAPKARTTAKYLPSSLHQAFDMRMHVDLKMLVTTQHPDMILLSGCKKNPRR